MLFWDKWQFVKIIVLSSLFSTTANAGITLAKTRVVYPSNEAYVNVQMSNQMDKPALAQVWTDNGDPKVIPAAKDNPFLVTPPVSRVNAQANQIFRVMLKPNMNLAQDRESLYWLNVLDVPPLSKADADKNILQFSVRSRLKLFYRPANLSITQKDAFQAVTFTQQLAQKSIEITNPSPYYITFNRLNFKPVTGKDILYAADVMVAPFASKSINMKTFDVPLRQVSYEVINDLGGNEAFEADIR